MELKFYYLLLKLTQYSPTLAQILNLLLFVEMVHQIARERLICLVSMELKQLILLLLLESDPHFIPMEVCT